MIKNSLYNKDIFNFQQIKDKKQKFAINAILNLVYNAQIIKNKNNILFCLFINIKEVFN